MTTQERLDKYLAAESAILEAQEIRGGDRTYRMAELSEVRKAIMSLERQVRREAAGASSGPRFAVANLSGNA